MNWAWQLFFIGFLLANDEPLKLELSVTDPLAISIFNKGNEVEIFANNQHSDSIIQFLKSRKIDFEAKRVTSALIFLKIKTSHGKFYDYWLDGGKKWVLEIIDSADTSVLEKESEKKPKRQVASQNEDASESAWIIERFDFKKPEINFFQLDLEQNRNRYFENLAYLDILPIGFEPEKWQFISDPVLNKPKWFKTVEKILEKRGFQEAEILVSKLWENESIRSILSKLWFSKLLRIFHEVKDFHVSLNILKDWANRVCQNGSDDECVWAIGQVVQLYLINNRPIDALQLTIMLEAKRPELGLFFKIWGYSLIRDDLVLARLPKNKIFIQCLDDCSEGCLMVKRQWAWSLAYYQKLQDSLKWIDDISQKCDKFVSPSIAWIRSESLFWDKKWELAFSNLIDLYHQSDDIRYKGLALIRLGEIQWLNSQYEKAQGLFLRALTVVGQIDPEVFSYALIRSQVHRLPYLKGRSLKLVFEDLLNAVQKIKSSDARSWFAKMILKVFLRENHWNHFEKEIWPLMKNHAFLKDTVNPYQNVIFQTGWVKQLHTIMDELGVPRALEFVHQNPKKFMNVDHRIDYQLAFYKIAKYFSFENLSSELLQKALNQWTFYEDNLPQFYEDYIFQKVNDYCFWLKDYSKFLISEMKKINHENLKFIQSTSQRCENDQDLSKMVKVLGVLWDIQSGNWDRVSWEALFTHGQADMNVHIARFIRAHMDFWSGLKGVWLALLIQGLNSEQNESLQRSWLELLIHEEPKNLGMIIPLIEPKVQKITEPESVFWQKLLFLVKMETETDDERVDSLLEKYSFLGSEWNELYRIRKFRQSLQAITKHMRDSGF